MAFERKLPEWHQPGVEPSETQKKTGFQPGMKPPAQWFNWFMNWMYLALKEFQEKAVEKSYVDSVADELRVEIGNADIPDASLTVKGKVQLSNETNGMRDDLASTEKALSDVNRTLTDHVYTLASQDSALRKMNTDLQREVAYLKLKQEAAERIENGTTFADDMSGNSFGTTFNESESVNISKVSGGVVMSERKITTNTVTNAPLGINTGFTDGNGGRKLIKLKTGKLIAVSINKTDAQVHVFASEDNGKNWTQISQRGFQSPVNDTCVTAHDKGFFVFTTYYNKSVHFARYNLDGGEVGVDNIEITLSSANGVSAVVNNSSTEVHVTWSGKSTSINPNSSNIFYKKGTIKSDGTVTWSSFESVTTMNDANANYSNPSITLTDDESPFIACRGDGTSITKGVYGFKKNLSTSVWMHRHPYAIGSNAYLQSNPSVVFVPSSINGLSRGRIWVTWHGVDSIDRAANNISVTFSDNGGDTWSTATKITNGDIYSQHLPSITADNNNRIYIVWYGATTNSPTKGLIRYSKFENSTWSEIVEFTDTLGLNYPSCLVDLSVSVKSPIFIHSRASSFPLFQGTWDVYKDTPTLNGSVIYDLPSTDYVGSFVKKAGDVDIKAYVNDSLMDSDLENDEYMFMKKLNTKEPVKLRLELSRLSTKNGNNDKVTRLLGGIS